MAENPNHEVWILHTYFCPGCGLGGLKRWSVTLNHGFRLGKMPFPGVTIWWTRVAYLKDLDGS